METEDWPGQGTKKIGSKRSEKGSWKVNNMRKSKREDGAPSSDNIGNEQIGPPECGPAEPGKQINARKTKRRKMDECGKESLKMEQSVATKVENGSDKTSSWLENEPSAAKTSDEWLYQAAEKYEMRLELAKGFAHTLVAEIINEAVKIAEKERKERTKFCDKIISSVVNGAMLRSARMERAKAGFFRTMVNTVVNGAVSRSARMERAKVGFFRTMVNTLVRKAMEDSEEQYKRKVGRKRKVVDRDAGSNDVDQSSKRQKYSFYNKAIGAHAWG